MGILGAIAELAVSVIGALGYVGVFVLMVMESMILPVPSEAVLPFAGFLVSRGEMGFASALAVATAGTLVGSLLSYGMGLLGVRALLVRYGKYVLVTPHHVDVAHRFFERRSATFAIFASRFIPIVRHLISIPAGGARMPLAPFVIATVLGGAVWNGILLYAGYALGENWAAIEPALDEAKLIVAAVLVVLALGVVVWWAARQRERRRGA